MCGMCGGHVGWDQCLMCEMWVCDWSWPDHGDACTGKMYMVSVRIEEQFLFDEFPLGTSVGAIYRWVQRKLRRPSCDFLLVWNDGRFAGKALSAHPVPYSLEEDACFVFQPAL